MAVVNRDAGKPLGIREPFCGLSHGAGALLSLVGLIVLLILSRGEPWKTTAFAIYGTSLVVLYTCSALHHSIRGNPMQRFWLRKCDHMAIYLLIAGSYTPLCLLVLKGALGWTMLAVECALAVTGICVALLWRGAPVWIRLVLYLAMGWMIVLVFKHVLHALPMAAIPWMVAGGLAYSIGAVIFATNRPHLWPGRFSAHDLWHVFVLGGSACHFVLILRYIALAPAMG